MQTVEVTDYIKSVVKASGTSFYWAMRILPPKKRNAIFAVYAFCREVDDIADSRAENIDKLRLLADWRAEIDKLFAGCPELPVSRALSVPIKQFGLRKETFLEVIEGMEFDASSSVRVPTILALEEYCDLVACAVGRLANQIFEIEKPLGEPVAVALGQALQLTNILRDLNEDAKINRMYVPKEMLSAYGITDPDTESIINHPKFPKICSELASIARQRFIDAEMAISCCDRKKIIPAIMMMKNYSRILDKLVKRGWRRLSEPVSLSKIQKFWLAISTTVRSRKIFSLD